MWDLVTVLLVVSPFTAPAPHRAPDAVWRPLKKLALHLEVVGPCGPLIRSTPSLDM